MIGFLGAMVATWGYFEYFNGVRDIWMSAVMGFFQLAFCSPGLRSTRPNCSRRVFAAPAPVSATMWAVSSPRAGLYNGDSPVILAKGATTPEEKLAAFRETCQWMSLIFLLGLVALFSSKRPKEGQCPKN